MIPKRLQNIRDDLGSQEWQPSSGVRGLLSIHSRDTRVRNLSQVMVLGL